MADDPKVQGDPQNQDIKTTPGEGDPKPGEGDKFELPDHLKGKTPEELAKIVVEKESAYGKQSTEVGGLRAQLKELEDNLNYMRGVEAIRQQQEAKRKAELEKQTQQEPDTRPKWNYEDPIQSVDERIDAKEQKLRGEAQQARLQENIALAREAYAEGQKVMGGDEKWLYEGIEDDVRKAVFNFYAPALEQGQDVSRYMRDPQAWKIAAQNIRLKRNEVDKLKPPEGLDPPAPADSTAPGAPKPGAAPAGELDPEVKMIAEQYGLTHEQAAEIIAKEAEIQGVR